MEEEKWKDIDGHPGYQVSNKGVVKSLNYNHTGKEKILKPFKNRDGYLLVKLYKDGKMKHFYVHRLVASAFVQNDSLFNNEINHLDENKENNCASNLEWSDRKHNCNYGSRNEQLSKVLTNNSKRSKPVKCLENGVVYPSTMEVQRKLGFSSSNISQCCQGKRNYCGGYRWKYVE